MNKECMNNQQPALSARDRIARATANQSLNCEKVSASMLLNKKEELPQLSKRETPPEPPKIQRVKFAKECQSCVIPIDVSGVPNLSENPDNRYLITAPTCQHTLSSIYGKASIDTVVSAYDVTHFSIPRFLQYAKDMQIGPQLLEKACSECSPNVDLQHHGEIIFTRNSNSNDWYVYDPDQHVLKINLLSSKVPMDANSAYFALQAISHDAIPKNFSKFTTTQELLTTWSVLHNYANDLIIDEDRQVHQIENVVEDETTQDGLVTVIDDIDDVQPLDLFPSVAQSKTEDGHGMWGWEEPKKEIDNVQMKCTGLVQPLPYQDEDIRRESVDIEYSFLCPNKAASKYVKYTQEIGNGWSNNSQFLTCILEAGIHFWEKSFNALAPGECVSIGLFSDLPRLQARSIELAITRNLLSAEDMRDSILTLLYTISQTLHQDIQIDITVKGMIFTAVE